MIDVMLMVVVMVGMMLMYELGRVRRESVERDVDVLKDEYESEIVMCGSVEDDGFGEEYVDEELEEEWKREDGMWGSVEVL